MLLNVFVAPRDCETNPCLEMLAEIQIYLKSVKELQVTGHFTTTCAGRRKRLSKT